MEGVAQYVRYLNALYVNVKWERVIGEEMQRMVRFGVAVWDEAGIYLVHRPDLPKYVEFLEFNDED